MSSEPTKYGKRTAEQEVSWLPMAAQRTPPKMIQTATDAQTADTLSEVAAWCHTSQGEELAATETILFVEDETFVREVTSEVLRSAGYRILTAKNSVEAAEAYDARCGAVDLLLTDVILPGETGRSLAGRLRRENPRLKVLFISGYAEQIGLHEPGAEECLAKPFSGSVLLRRLRQVLDRTEQHSEQMDPVRRACGSA